MGNKASILHLAKKLSPFCSCYILAKEFSPFCPFEGARLICGGNSRDYNIEVVAWILLAAFTQVYSENWDEKLEQKDF